MKRRLLIVATFLLAGAVVNVAVAWGCALWSPIGVGKSRPPTVLEQQWAAQHEGVAIMQGDMVAFERRSVGTRWVNLASPQYRWFLCSAGLPAHSLQGFVRFHFVNQSGSRENIDVLEVGKYTGSSRYLPYRPIWPGFAVNTIFYAAILWLPFVVRRWVRVRRGLCPKCAYPIGQSDVCSECGKPLPGRARVAT